MKRVLLLIFLISFIHVVFGQHFDEFFVNKTLRINYLHIGKNDSEQIELISFNHGGKWSGTRNYLIEPSRLGDMLIEVFEIGTGKLVFSRSYSCLFGEYASTKRAETEIGSFEEAINIPYPKSKINFKITSFSRKQIPNVLYEGTFDPTSTKSELFTKEHKVKNIHIGGSIEKSVDILFIPDGYSLDDKSVLKADMERFANYVLNCSPFSEHKDKINIRAIEGYSEESGITDPNSKIYKKTLLNCSFNTIDLDRYLMCLNIFKMHDIAEDAPYDIIILICNTPKYGGGGIYNFYCTVNNKGEKSNYVIVHELGHLLAGLGDEYFSSEVSVRDYYPEGIEPVEPNLTTLVAFDKKWKNLIDTEIPIPTPDKKQYNNVLGVYEGGGYVAKGVYRPWRNCTMKDPIYNNFCPVCQKAIIETFEYYSK